jgi:hypothetical protein
MKNIYANILLILFPILLPSCAVIDTSGLETADTIPKGKIKLAIEASIGTELLFSAEQFEQDSLIDFQESAAAAIGALNFGFGLDDKSDIHFKAWGSGFGGIGFRIFFKTKFKSKNENITRAIAPGVNFLKYDGNDDTHSRTEDVRSFGFEIPYIQTRKLGKYFSTTGIIRYGFDQLLVDSVINDDFETKEYSLHRIGIIGGISLKFKQLPGLRICAGVEVLSPMNDLYSYSPIFGFGIVF